LLSAQCFSIIFVQLRGVGIAPLVVIGLELRPPSIRETAFLKPSTFRHEKYLSQTPTSFEAKISKVENDVIVYSTRVFSV